MPTELSFTVTEINSYVKKIIDYEDLLQSIQVRGEISNFSRSSAGHIYFTLKDEFSTVRCVWFSTEQKAPTSFKDGSKVVVRANASFYIKNGEFQLNVKAVSAAGVGYWFELFNNIKTKLSQEGLFDESIKKKLPAFPKKIGIITSEHGAALQDIIKVARRKKTPAEIVLFPVTVQGQSAAYEISAALDWFSQNPIVDLLILARGGGSIEDLWAFNEEIVARSIYNCPLPVISAVGHETDFSISDFAADIRAATPTMAADIAFTGKDEQIRDLYLIKNSLFNQYSSHIKELSWELGSIRSTLASYSPIARLKTDTAVLADIKSNMDNIIKYVIDLKMARLTGQKVLLDSFNPKSVLHRGYSIIMDRKGHVLNTVSALNDSRLFNVIVSDGSVPALVDEENGYEL